MELITSREYREVAWTCRAKVRNANTQYELKLDRGAKNNKKGFFRCAQSKRNERGSITI